MSMIVPLSDKIGRKAPHAMIGRFHHYALRTTDVEAAHAFYTDVFGASFIGPWLSIVPLPERAAAAGAPAHWLGHIGVDDARDMAERMTALGAQLLGPLQRDADGTSIAVLCDPFGAPVALTSAPLPQEEDPVAWRMLHARDHEKAFAYYAMFFRWAPMAVVDLGPGLGRMRSFAWREGGADVGGVTDAARVPHIHPQWLYFFPVADIHRAIDTVQARGGRAMGITSLPSGDRAAACEDPQGGAFGLYQHAPK